MKRTLTGLTAVAVFIIAVLAAAGYYAVEMRRINRDKQYAEMRANAHGEVRVTIPEGWRREQIAARLEQAGVTASADFLDATRNDEGRLFPDTYQFFPATPAQQIRDTLRQTYEKKAPAVDQSTLIIASIVEREAKQDGERATIASVYWNRLKMGMTLGADPTVQYGKDTLSLTQDLKEAATIPGQVKALDNFKFWQPITQADYSSVDSPYNTYLHTGLPPGPICNPGAKSLEAALHPAQTNYLYFFHTADGTAIFSKTLDEHLKNQQKYL